MALPLVLRNFEVERSGCFLSPACGSETGETGSEENHGGWFRYWVYVRSSQIKQRAKSFSVARSKINDRISLVDPLYSQSEIIICSI